MVRNLLTFALLSFAVVGTAYAAEEAQKHIRQSMQQLQSAKQNLQKAHKKANKKQKGALKQAINDIDNINENLKGMTQDKKGAHAHPYV